MPAEGIWARREFDISPDVVKRFWSKVIKGRGCWIWSASTRSTGYGCMKVSGWLVSAHRLSYVIHHGNVPDDMIVCHSCDNRLCVRPDHLFAGTPRDNVADMDDKGRSNRARGEQQGVHKLSDKRVCHIRRLSAAGVSNRRIAAMNGVSPSTIDRIVNRQGWKHVL